MSEFQENLEKLERLPTLGLSLLPDDNSELELSRSCPLCSPCLVCFPLLSPAWSLRLPGFVVSALCSAAS